MKVIAIVAGAMLAAALVMLKVQRDHEETLHHQRLIEMLQSQRDELAKLGAENARLSNLVALANSPANDPSDEMLRLRGEVATLRREAADNQRQNGRSGARPEGSAQTNTSLWGQFAVPEADLDGFINIPIGASTNDAFAEIQRVGAQLVTNEPGFILAAITIPTTNRDVSPSVVMEFYFDDDRLSSKIYRRLPGY